MKEAAWAHPWLRFTDKGLGDSQEEQRIKSCLPMVISVCTRFKRKTEDDLQVGLMGLVKAAQTYDPSRKASFATHAYNCIRNEINHVLDRETTKKRTGKPSSKPVEVLVSREPNPAYAVEMKLDAKRVMHRFMPADRVVVRGYMAGKSLTEVGRELGVTRARTYQRFHRCLERGREFFAEAV
jgi:RNA polymerase sigma factor (sigma-70 family)